VNAVRGSPPHLTPDLAAQVKDLKSFNVAIADIVPLLPAIKAFSKSVEGAEEHPYHTMMALHPEHSFMLSLRNPTMDVTHLGGNANGAPQTSGVCPNTASKKEVFVVSDRGNIKLTPESFLQNADIVRPDFVSLLCEEGTVDGSNSRTEKVMRRNIEWVDACLQKYNDVFDGAYKPFIFVPVEGGKFLDKRTRHARVMAYKGTEKWRVLAEPDANDAAAVKQYKERVLNEGVTVPRAADGFILGGLASAESTEEMRNMILASLKSLPADKPRMANVVGDPSEVIALVSSGIDLINTSYPMLMTESGLALIAPITEEELDATIAGKQKDENKTAESEEDVQASTLSLVVDHPELDHQYLNLRNFKYREDARPIMKGCECYACQHHTRAYINHLLNAHEMLAEVLLMMHNTHQYGLLYAQLREKITEGPAALEQYVAKANKVHVPHTKTLDMSGRKKVKPRDMREDEEEEN